VTPFNQDIMYGIGGWRIGDGRLSKLLVDYAKMDLARDAGKITPFLERLETKDTSLASDTTFISILRDAATDPVMQTTQETSFDTETLDPALKVATSLGIKTPLGILLVYDSRVLGGFPAAAKATTETLGGSPANGIDEHAYVTKLDQLRHDALRQLGQRYPAFEKTWLKRADFITALIAKEDWQLDGDIALPADH
jgi:chitosanase